MPSLQPRMGEAYHEATGAVSALQEPAVGYPAQIGSRSKIAQNSLNESLKIATKRREASELQGAIGGAE